jgi:gliding motility-associated-like protein/uncharacterized repeat protein (TIGR01451 family)
MTYRFVSADDQCASSTTMDISVTNAITPIFDQIGPLMLNSVAPELPSASLNNPAITGTWTPASINTALPGRNRYMFTSIPGQCATNYTMEIDVLAPSLEIRKIQTSGPNPVTASGQVLYYLITLTNTGTTDINGVNASEIYPGPGAGTLSEPEESIASDRILSRGETWRYTATYTVVQSDIDAGRSLTNTVNITTTQIPGPLSASALTPIGTVPSLSILKSATEDNYSAVGNEIHYHIVVRNTGGTSLSDIIVTDHLTGLNQVIPVLSPGAQSVFNTTYTVGQNDLNVGRIVNTAQATFTFAGTTHTVSDVLTINADQNPELILIKRAASSSYSSIGEVIHYTITIRNTGNISLSGIRVSDPVTGLNQVVATLLPGASYTINTTHVVVQNDLNTGHLDNTATAEYSYSGNSYIVTDNVRVTAAQNPELRIRKTASETVFTAAGDIIHYVVNITNTGNVTITDVIPSDPNTVLTCTGAPFVLTPGASRSCNAIHVISANDVLNGHYENIASVSGLSPDRNRINATSNSVTISLNNVAPLINCPGAINVPTRNSSCDALITNGLSATYSDPNNNIASLSWLMTGATRAASPSTGINNLREYTFNRGVTTVTYTVTDRLGLSSSCNFTVTVIDNVPPVIRCAGSQNRFTDHDGPGYTTSGTEFDPVSLSDNCSVSRVINNVNGHPSLSGVAFPVGITNVIWTVTDQSGNSTSCNFNITVTDNVIPEARCKNIDVYLDLNTGRFTLSPGDIDAGSFDNTGIASMAIDLTNFDCSDVGPNNVTLTVTDKYGNTGTCTSVVNVLYAVSPAASVTAAEQVLCNDGITNIGFINNIPGTSWTWLVNPSNWIRGVSADNSGRLNIINQNLQNTDSVAHSIVYTVEPRVYGLCNLPEIPVTVWVNPQPKIRVNPGDTIICNGESSNISVRNPNTFVRDRWIYDLSVDPDKGISGSSPGGTFAEATRITDRLINSDTVLHKVEYRFTPRIESGEDGNCPGATHVVTIWVRPQIRYITKLSDFNGYNISCFNKTDGFILLNSMHYSGPLSYMWRGPEGFESSGDFVRRLGAGTYTVTISDINKCSIEDTISLKAPEKLSMRIEPSISSDGAFNINCADEATGSIVVSPFNSIGSVTYLWKDGNSSASRDDLKAGEYKVIITDSNNCQADSSITLTQPEKMTAEFSVSLPYCPEKPDGEVKLVVTGGVQGNDYKYMWSDNSSSQVLSGIKSGVYQVEIIDLNGCSLKSAVIVNALHDLCLVIPEAISPNNDLVNDIWNIENSDLYPDIEILIYNRWGQLLWKSEMGYPKPWDGKSNGRVLPVDSYHYVIDLHNGMKPIMGSITIVK